MDRLDHLVAEHLEERLLNPKRLEDLLATHLDRRDERAARRRDTANEFTKRATEAEQRLKRLYDAIESGVADLSDPSLKERVARCVERTADFGATICGVWRSESRSLSTKSGSWARATS